MKNNEPNNIPNDTLKWLKNSRFYGSLDKIFDVSLSKLQPGKEAQMGKSLNGKELGKGISQGQNCLYVCKHPTDNSILSMHGSWLTRMV